MTPLLETTGWALIHFVWQGAAIAAAAATILRVLRRRSAGSVSGSHLSTAAPMSTLIPARTTKTPRHEVMRSSWPPMVGASTGPTPVITMSSEK